MAQNYKHQVHAALHYWQQKTQNSSHKSMLWLDERRANMLKSVEEGLKYEDLWEETAVVITQVFHFMEWRGYWQSWIPILEKTTQKCHDPETNILYIRLNSQLAQFYRLDHQFAEAEKQHQIVLNLAKQSQNHEQLAAIYQEIGYCHLIQNRLQEAERFTLLALKHSENVPKNKRLTAFILQTLGIIKRVCGEYQAALAYLEPVVTIRRDLAEDVLLADVLNEVARTYEGLQDYETALHFIDEALTIIEQSSNEKLRTVILMNKGVFYYRQNRLPEAEAIFHQVDFFSLKRQGNLFHCGLALQNLGNVLFDQGKLVEAEPYIQEAINIFQMLQDEIYLGNNLGTLAQILKAQGKPATALALFDEAILLLEKYPENAWANSLAEKYIEGKKALE